MLASSRWFLYLYAHAFDKSLNFNKLHTLTLLTKENFDNIINMFIKKIQCTFYIVSIREALLKKGSKVIIL